MELPVLHGLAVMLICIGLTLELALFHGETRRGVPVELKNLNWVLLGNSLALGGMATLYYAMAGLPATIVSTISATNRWRCCFWKNCFITLASPDAVTSGC